MPEKIDFSVHTDKNIMELLKKYPNMLTKDDIVFFPDMWQILDYNEYTLVLLLKKMDVELKALIKMPLFYWAAKNQCYGGLLAILEIMSADEIVFARKNPDLLESIDKNNKLSQQEKNKIQQQLADVNSIEVRKYSFVFDRKDYIIKNRFLAIKEKAPRLEISADSSPEQIFDMHNDLAEPLAIPDKRALVSWLEQQNSDYTSNWLRLLTDDNQSLGAYCLENGYIDILRKLLARCGLSKKITFNFSEFREHNNDHVKSIYTLELLFAEKEVSLDEKRQFLRIYSQGRQWEPNRDKVAEQALVKLHKELNKKYRLGLEAPELEFYRTIFTQAERDKADWLRAEEREEIRDNLTALYRYHEAEKVAMTQLVNSRGQNWLHVAANNKNSAGVVLLSEFFTQTQLIDMALVADNTNQFAMTLLLDNHLPLALPLLLEVKLANKHVPVETMAEWLRIIFKKGTTPQVIQIIQWLRNVQMESPATIDQCFMVAPPLLQCFFESAHKEAFTELMKLFTNDKLRLLKQQGTAESVFETGLRKGWATEISLHLNDWNWFRLVVSIIALKLEKTTEPAEIKVILRKTPKNVLWVAEHCEEANFFDNKKQSLTERLKNNHHIASAENELQRLLQQRLIETEIEEYLKELSQESKKTKQRQEHCKTMFRRLDSQAAFTASIEEAKQKFKAIFRTPFGNVSTQNYLDLCLKLQKLNISPEDAKNIKAEYSGKNNIFYAWDRIREKSMKNVEALEQDFVVLCTEKKVEKIEEEEESSSSLSWGLGL